MMALYNHALKGDYTVCLQSKTITFHEISHREDATPSIALKVN